MTIQFNSFNNENNELIKVSTGVSKKSDASGNQSGKKSVFAGKLNMPADPIAEKREKARKQAMKVYLFLFCYLCCLIMYLFHFLS